MKITSKISFLIFSLFMVLAFNTLVGLHQIQLIDFEFNEVVNRNVTLTELVTAINHRQLEKSILFERMLRISEELAFDRVADSRRDHLIFQADLIRQGFDHYTQMGASDIMKVRELIRSSLVAKADIKMRNHLLRVQDFINAIEQSHIRHAQVISDILLKIHQGSFELSFEDLEKVRIDEERFNSQIKNFLIEVQLFTRNSLFQSQIIQEKARVLLLFSLSLSVVIASLFVYFLTKSISRPLKRLISCANNIGEGRFNVDLHEFSRDEIGEVSRAMKVMSDQLNETQATLRLKNQELVRSLEVMQIQKEDLQKVNHELDRFVYTVSHDIGAPLRGIAWYADQLKKNHYASVDLKSQEHMDGIQLSVKKLNQMIVDLLALTRISRIKNPFEVVDINELLDHITQRFTVDIQQLKVDYHLPGNVPSIVCDRIKLGELFYNLINNAIKFSSKIPTQNPRIEIGYEQSKTEHVFFVKDNGIGIDPAYHQQVFGVFRRLNSGNEYSGSGIGLSIVEDVVKLHHGKVGIESQTGEGCKIWFTIAKNLSNRSDS